MCRLTRKVNNKTFTGYKIVSKDENGNFYSTLMGFKYPKRGKVPIPNIQKILCKGGHEGILTSIKFFQNSMIGRTCAIRTFQEAKNLFYRIDSVDGYKLVIVKITISKELMSGNYNGCSNKVIGGKYICKMEEVNGTEY